MEYTNQAYENFEGICGRSIAAGDNKEEVFMDSTSENLSAQTITSASINEMRIQPNQSEVLLKML